MNRWEFSTSCCSYTCISINVSLRENRTLALTKHDRASPNVIDKQTNFCCSRAIKIVKKNTKLSQNHHKFNVFSFKQMIVHIQYIHGSYRVVCQDYLLKSSRMFSRMYVSL